MLDICASYAEHVCLPCRRRKRSARADAAVTYVSLMTRATYVSPMPQARAERKSGCCCNICVSHDTRNICVSHATGASGAQELMLL